MRRQLDNNTRYKVGKKNAQGWYETSRGQAARAKAAGAI